MGVSKNRGIPKWMVYFMENPIKMDDLGVPLFLETPMSTNDSLTKLQCCPCLGTNDMPLRTSSAILLGGS